MNVISVNRRQWDNLLYLRGRTKHYGNRPNISAKFADLYKGTLSTLKVA